MYPYRPCRHEFVRTFDWNNKASNQLYYRSLLPTIDVATDMIRLPRLEHVPIYTELTFEGASDTYQHSRMYVRRIAARAVKLWGCCERFESASHWERAPALVLNRATHPGTFLRPSSSPYPDPPDISKFGPHVTVVTELKEGVVIVLGGLKQVYNQQNFIAIVYVLGYEKDLYNSKGSLEYLTKKDIKHRMSKQGNNKSEKTLVSP